MPYPYQKSGDAEGNEVLYVFLPGRPPVIVPGDHPKFEEILLAATEGRSDAEVDLAQEIENLADQTAAVATVFEPISERVSVANGRVYFDGDEVHSSISAHIIRCIERCEETQNPTISWPKAEIAFLEKVGQNPVEHSREQLYDWLQAEGFSILPDGDIVGYKGVKPYSGDERTLDGEKFAFESGNAGVAIVDGTRYEGQIPQNVGSVVEMPRSAVAHDPSDACSTGLHVGTFSYAQDFAAYPKGEHTLKVAVNPRDVVSVPTHAHGNKIRVCRYRVIEADPEQETAPVSVPHPDDQSTDEEPICSECGDNEDVEGGYCTFCEQDA